MQNNRNSHSLLIGMQNGSATLEDSLAVSYRAQHSLSIHLGSCAPKYLATEFKTYVYPKTLHKCL